MKKLRAAEGLALILFAGLSVHCSVASVSEKERAALPPALTGAAGASAWSRAQNVFDARCVVCHGCFDAPCQLKLDSFDGIARGASATPVYAGRPLAIEPTRLFIDARDNAGWRKKGFHPVVPEAGTPGVGSSVLLRMLALKREHPLTADVDVAATFTLSLDRKETCTKEDGVDAYAKAHPLWGMPYGLPGLSDDENDALVSWVEAGMPHPEPPPLSPALSKSVDEWESFLNDDSLRGRLVARYLFEHLYFASLYFEGEGHTFFQVVRSRTAPGVAVDEIATRRPYDDPKIGRPFYRLVHRERQPLDKTHIPYSIGPARRAWIEGLFFGPQVIVSSLPGYEPKLASNPFKVFAALPVDSRYRFLLEEAEYTMMGFIKGTVCRGNVALNVINDRFWVTFIDPDSPWMKEQAAFLADSGDLLDLPAEGGSNAPLLQWTKYGAHHKQYLDKKSAYLKRLAARGDLLTPALIWDGDGTNTNAALTIFRHYDHGTVVRGLVGGDPSTGFVADYALLERITYLLIAGFDVFGGISHQMQTRMYMDYLRMEAEHNFLVLVPAARRTQLIDLWYRGLGKSRKDDVDAHFAAFPGEPKISYSSKSPEHELFASIEQRLAPVRSRRFDASSAPDAAIRQALAKLNAVTGSHASFMPELSFVSVTGGEHGPAWLTILRDSAHSSVSQIFDEDKRRRVNEDELTAVPGFLGAYPDALFTVPIAELDAFATAVAAVNGATAYAALRKRWGVMRNNPDFWKFSDIMRDAAHTLDPIGAGVFDYGRLDAL